MQEFSEMLDGTAIADRWMSVENAKNLGTAEIFEIYILPL